MFKKSLLFFCPWSSHTPLLHQYFMERERGKVVVYLTTLGIVRDTYERCLRIRKILWTLLVRFEERDVFMARDTQLQLLDRLHSSHVSVPHVFLEGQYLGVGAKGLLPTFSLFPSTFLIQGLTSTFTLSFLSLVNCKNLCLNLFFPLPNTLNLFSLFFCIYLILLTLFLILFTLLMQEIRRTSIFTFHFSLK
uniref:Glutaredoxin domain-containing protein n=1 Tax=Scylla olivacea TaxID=85551 RepID=A0A0P4WLS5_SCYOL